MDQLEQEVHELRGEVTTLRAEVEKLTSLVSSLMATNDLPLVQQRPQSPYQPMCPQKPRQQTPRQSIPQNQVPQKFIPQNQVQKASQCDPIPVKYADLLPILLKKNLIQTLPLPRVPNSLPPWYRPDLNCVFHQGAPDIKVLFQQQHLAPHSVAAVRPITNVVQDPGYQPQFQQYQQQPRQQAPRIKFDPIPMKYGELFPYLLERNLVQTRPPPPIPKKLPARWRPDLFCLYQKHEASFQQEKARPHECQESGLVLKSYTI
ncbi:RNA polymerase II degradation factor 1-like [Medicago truncatula]|uniref:RNA polymerase II degradation factor 1-like n=1 Tax=Medicago truncatula TaxID=3880 RepID=UPI001967D3F2|nr:RNA polymerase II degradation factor 1-like [Medicago truncatula]XP_039690621.1 RNA polymerase II degradation factor 1-like [Medicago truncatula]